MTIAFRLLCGMGLGIEFAPAPGVYCTLQLFIVEIALFNEELFDE